ncbi:MAG TPA: BBP7 family outer membrane beta-barrel protein [Thermoguttaceae bacterium]
MSSHGCFVTIISALLLSVGSSAIAVEPQDSAGYQVITSNREYDSSSAAWGAGSGSDCACSDCASSDCGGCCDEDCYQRCCCPRWTATADIIFLDRIGSKSQTLVRETDRQSPTDGVLLDSKDFDFGFRGGPRVSLIRHGDNCYDLEFLYFQIDGWRSSRRVDIDLPGEDGIEFSVPGHDVYSTFDPMKFDYDSKLYNAELNVRWAQTCRITMLAGFRWAKLRENFAGELEDTIDIPFWNTETVNNLYGFQIGADAKLWQCCRFSINGLLKAGIYANHAEQTSWLQYDEYEGSASGSTDHTAFLGEIGLVGKYQVNDCLTLRIGYQLLWLDGVALPPNQIPVTYLDLEDSWAGVDAKNTVFYHGATAGFEYKF